MDKTLKLNLLEKIVSPLYERLADCDICPRNCRVNRLKGKQGFCKTDKDLIVYSAFLHQGEEPGISGTNGSGTIFFSGCNLKCVYCQNYKFSHNPKGKKVNEQQLAQIMVNLQEKGAHNINLVTPTHFLPQILKALMIAYQAGLKIPIVYNTSGYEKKLIIQQLNGIIDIYLNDIKYFSPETAKQYSNSPDYPEICQESTKEMYSQKEISYGKADILKSGLVIRHLVMPNHIQESKDILDWIKQNIPFALISVMFQYQPYFKAKSHSSINRPVNIEEYSQIKAFIEKIGVKGWVQDFTPLESLAGPYFKPNIEDI